MADKIFLNVVPEKNWSIEDINGQQYTLAKAKELYEKKLVIEAPTFQKLRMRGFDLEALKDYYR